MSVMESLFKTNDIEKIYLYVPYYNKDYNNILFIIIYMISLISKFKKQS